MHGIHGSAVECVENIAIFAQSSPPGARRNSSR